MIEHTPAHPAPLRIAITGATGFVGRAITRAALAAGHHITNLGRRPWPGPESASFQSWSLGEKPDLVDQDALIHAAFAHVPGRYRGGEGEDAAAFLRTNLNGSIALFDAAEAAGVGRCLFLSSRAVFDGYPPGTKLTEVLPPEPTTLYGRIKAEAEHHLTSLASPGFQPIALRATGVYDWPEPGIPHKWRDLFARFLAGEQIAPAIATEVHADDLARAVLLLLCAAAAPPAQSGAEPGPITSNDSTAPAECGVRAIHISDLILDRRSLLHRLSFHLPAQRVSGCKLPAPSSPETLRVLDCSTLERLGWRGGGEERLDQTLAKMAQSLP